jgi:hypothetical protein
MYETADDRLRIRTIEVLGVSYQSHPEAAAILIAAWGVLVEPCSRGTIERALFATLLILVLRRGVSQLEPKRRGRKGSRGRKAVKEAILAPACEAADSCWSGMPPRSPIVGKSNRNA